MKFTPTASGTYVGTLVVNHTGTNTSPINIDLTSVASYQATLTPSGAPGSAAALPSLNVVTQYPTTGTGPTSTGTYYLRNTGASGQLSINNISITGASAANYAVTAVQPVNPSGAVTTACADVTATGMTTTCTAAEVTTAGYRH